MTTTTRQVLYSKQGENLPTPPSPIGPWTGQVDLETTEMFCAHHDDDRLVESLKYSVREIQLPEWLSTEEYCANADYVKWQFLWAFGASPDWSEACQRFLLNLDGASQLACIKLLKTKAFRSEFRKSLYQQLMDWIWSSERKHPSPFSPKQWDCLVDVYTRRAAHQLGEQLYHNIHYCGAAVAKAA